MADSTSGGVLEFINKGTRFSSITGEKLSEFQVVAAVRSGFAELGLPLEDFTLCPVMHERPNHVLLVEADACGSDAARLAERIEFHLRKLNSEYAEKVKSGRLMPLAIRPIAPGTWRAFRQRRIAARGNLEEHKHPCLVGELDFIEKLGELPFAPTLRVGTHGVDAPRPHRKLRSAHPGRYHGRPWERARSTS